VLVYIRSVANLVIALILIAQWCQAPVVGNSHKGPLKNQGNPT
jgi:hypothetical protein